MKSEYEKMLSGELHDSTDSKLDKLRNRAQNLYQKYNTTNDKTILDELFGKKLDNVFIRAPFYCDYGIHINLGKNVYMNFNCVILDCANVEIGDNTFLAPNVQIYTAMHPLDVETRNKWIEYAKPVKIGNNCWIGGGTIILGGVTIGDNSVIGAGSVVTKSIPDNTIAYGNPCKPVRKI